jgi:protease PrsW
MESFYAFLTSLVLGFGPMLLYASIIYSLDRYEKEPFFLLGAVFTWGAVIAAAGAFIVNTTLGEGIILVTHSEGLADLTTGFMIAPLVEESLKGLAVLLVFWLYHNEFDSILDGIVYAAVAALGFAATENTFYIYNLGYLKGGWEALFSVTFIRTIVVGWQHPFFTSFLGIGLAYARMHQNQSAKFMAPLAGWAVSIMTHAFHNLLASLGVGVLCLLGSIIDWTGWIAMLIFIFYIANREKLLQKQYLQEEIDLGNISPAQYFTAQSSRLQTLALFKGSPFSTIQFYQFCAELTHKKNQLARCGEEGANSAIIQSLREKLKKLSPHAAAW